VAATCPKSLITWIAPCVLVANLCVLGCGAPSRNIDDSRKATTIASDIIPAGMHCIVSPSTNFNGLMVTIGDSLVAKVRSVDSLSVQAQLPHNDFVTRAAVVSGGFVTRTSGKGEVRYWKLDSKNIPQAMLLIPEKQHSRHNDPDPGALLADPEGKKLALLAWGSIQLFDIQGGSQSPFAVIPIRNDFAYADISYNKPDDQFILIASSDSRTAVARISAEEPNHVQYESLPPSYYARALQDGSFILIDRDGTISHLLGPQRKFLGRLPLAKDFQLRVFDVIDSVLYVAVNNTLFSIDPFSRKIRTLWNAPIGRINSISPGVEGDEIICGYGFPSGYLVKLRLN